MTRSSFMVLGCLGMTLCYSGCSKQSAQPHPTIPVTVTVRLNGSPLEGASVAFCPADSSKPGAAGTTDSSGIAKLMTFAPGDGAVAGQYKVTVTKIETPPAPKELKQEDAPPPPDKAPKPKFIVPQRYSQATTTDLSAEVSKDKSAFTFELKK